jgi:hypothetical protein
MIYPSPTAQELRDTYKRFMRPILQAVWFIDSRADYGWMMARYGDLFAKPGDIWGLQAREFYSAYATREDWQWAPWFAWMPGVWLVFSNGDVGLLQDRARFGL